MRIPSAALGIATCVLLLNGCTGSAQEITTSEVQSQGVEQVASEGEYILPGSPRHPVGENLSKVPESVPQSERLDFAAVPQRAEYDMLVRTSSSGPMVPSDVLRQRGYVSGIGEILGFTLYYTDGIVLTVTPTESDSDVLDKLDSTMATNTAGVSRPYEKGMARSRVAVVRPAGRQRWSSGIEEPYPALIVWDETSPQGIQLRYALFGYEQTPESLADVAGEMELLPMVPGDKTIDATSQESGRPLGGEQD